MEVEHYLEIILCLVAIWAFIWLKSKWSRWRFYQNHINNITPARRQQFKEVGADNGELRGITKSRLTVGMAVEIIKTKDSDEPYEITENDVIIDNRKYQKSRPKKNFSDGELNEAKAFELYKRQTGQDVSLIKDLVLPKTPWLIGSPDGVIYDFRGKIRTVLEVKTPDDKRKINLRVRKDRKGQLGPNKNSREFIQMQLYLYSAECENGEVIYYAVDDTIVRTFVELDLTLVKSWLPVLKRFYDLKMLPLVMSKSIILSSEERKKFFKERAKR